MVATAASRIVSTRAIWHLVMSPQGKRVVRASASRLTGNRQAQVAASTWTEQGTGT
jgi:hypothetical protein